MTDGDEPCSRAANKKIEALVSRPSECMRCSRRRVETNLGICSLELGDLPTEVLNEVVLVDDGRLERLLERLLACTEGPGRDLVPEGGQESVMRQPQHRRKIGLGDRERPT
jgi:hypothetical protein